MKWRDVARQKLNMLFGIWGDAAVAQFERRSSASMRRRTTYEYSEWPSVVYAVGDVHGRLDLLLEMERIVTADAVSIDGRKLIILLGDMIDRGPRSASIIDHMLVKPPAGFQRICVAGNHEVMMYEFLCGSYTNGWLESGGFETLASYGLDMHEVLDRLRRGRLSELLQSHIPDEHVDFLGGLPKYVRLPGCAFLHVPSESASAGDHRHKRGSAQAGWGLDYPASLEDLLLVHGHDVVNTSRQKGNRLNVDTGAYFTGRLTAARLRSVLDIQLIEASINRADGLAN